MQFPIKIEKDKDGYYAKCTILEGCSTSGNTYEEALVNIKDAIKLYIRDLTEDDKLIVIDESTTDD